MQAVAPLFGVSDIEAEIQAIEDEEPEETEQPPPMNRNQGKEPGERTKSPSGENGEGSRRHDLLQDLQRRCHSGRNDRPGAA